MFKRRTPKSYAEMILHTLYPRGGWARASRYVMHRLTRLPDPAYKIARGIAVGVFVSFTPFYGLHFLISAALAWLIRGNVVAALLATFFGNPLTFPVIATLSVELGSWMLGQEHIPAKLILDAITGAPIELWSNLAAIFTGAEVAWPRMALFVNTVFLPYLVGGLGPGLLAGIVVFFLTRPVIVAYQAARARRTRAQYERRRAREERERRAHTEG